MHKLIICVTIIILFTIKILFRQLVPCYRSFVINSVPHLVCLDDEDVTVIERGVAKGVAKLCTRGE